MNHNTANIGIVVALILAIAGWDVYSLLTSNPTLSNTILEWSRQWPIVSFLFGVLFGHLFWGQSSKK